MEVDNLMEVHKYASSRIIHKIRVMKSYNNIESVCEYTLNVYIRDSKQQKRDSECLCE